MLGRAYVILCQGDVWVVRGVCDPTELEMPARAFPQQRGILGPLRPDMRAMGGMTAAAQTKGNAIGGQVHRWGCLQKVGR